MTLMLIALVTASTAGLAAYSFRQTLDVANAQDELQRRWGLLTARSTILPNAARLLERANSASAAFSVSMGGMRFDLRIADEQAKVNVNALLATNETRDVDQIVRQICREDRVDLGIDLRPAVAPSKAGAANVSLVDGFGDVFTDDQPLALTELRDLTCWGDGRLNVRRASREALQAGCQDVLDLRTIEQLLAAQRMNPQPPLAEMLYAANLSDAQRQAANLLLTDKSACQSLWVTVRDSRRDWYSLFILDSASNGSDAAYTW